MANLKPLIQQLHEAYVERPPSFGQVMFSGEGLPEFPPAEAIPAPEPTQQDTEHPYDALARIASLRCESKKEKKKRDDLVARAASLLFEAQEFEQSVIAARKSELETAWKTSKAECRKQASVVAKLDSAWRSQEATVQTWSAQYDHDLNEMKAAQLAKLPAWPTDAEIAAKQQTVEAAKEKAVRASMERANALSERVVIEQQLRKEQETMNQLVATEMRLRHALDGKPFFDSEYGLEVR